MKLNFVTIHCAIKGDVEGEVFKLAYNMFGNHGAARIQIYMSEKVRDATFEAHRTTFEAHRTFYEIEL